MPLYDYKCPDCGSVREELMTRAVSVNAVIICPNCQKQMVKTIARPGKAKIVRCDLDWFGTPQFNEAHSKKCGVPT